MLELAVTGFHQAAMAIATRGRELQLRQQPPGPWEMGLLTVSQLNTSVSVLLPGTRQGQSFLPADGQSLLSSKRITRCWILSAVSS